MSTSRPPPVLVSCLLVAALLLGLTGCDGMSGGPSELSSVKFKAEEGWHGRTIRHAGRDRDFKYYVPPSLPENAPVVMALHGATIGMERMFPTAGEGTGSTEWVDIAREEGLLLVVPNGVHNNAPVWNDCTTLPDRGSPDDSGFLAALADWTTTQADVDSSRVFVYGVSNGGQMANRLAIEHPDRFAGIAALISNVNSKLGPDQECPMPTQPVSALILSGRSDATTPFDGGGTDVWGEPLLSAPATRGFWVANNVQGPPPPRQPVAFTDDLNGVSCERTPAPTTGADVQLCAFNGGHTVPTTESHGFESPRLAWDFFRRQ